MTVLVTGGSGVVGAAVVRHLTRDSRSVRALSRSATSDAKLAALGADPIRGDILDPRSLRRAMSNIETVYHVAGVNGMCLKDSAPMFTANIDGSLNVVRAARDAGVRRVVYTSSAAALGENKGVNANEGSQHRGWYLSAYEKSKHLAEQAVMAETGIEIVAVNPSSVQGPGRATGTGKLILDLASGRLPFLVDTDLSIVDIDDCARGHLAAADRGISGERYVLNSFTMTMRDAVAMVSHALGFGVSVRFLPGWMASIGGAVAGGMSRFTEGEPRVCREMVRTLLHGHSYDGAKARNELGIVYTDAETLMRRLVEWYRTEGLLEN